jgi:hypothetical protein
MVTGCFTVGSTRLCVDRAVLRGVLEAPEVSPAPGAPPWLLGACNRSGRAVAVVDVAMLGGLTREPAAPRWVVVVETPLGPIGLCAEGPLGELRAAVPARTGELLLEVEAQTWLVDVTRLPVAAEAALSGSTGAV